MQITKTGTGTYKCPSDLAQIELTLTLRGLKNDDWDNIIPKDKLIDMFLLRYKLFNDALQEFLTQNNIKSTLYFNQYRVNRVNKPKENEEDSTVLFRYDITGYFSMDINIKENKNDLTKLIDYFTRCNTKFNDIELNYDIIFTLSETMRDIAKGKATTIALSHIKKEIKEIATYLELNKINLTHIDFTNNSYVGRTGDFSRNASVLYECDSISKEERLDILDKMLNTKDIEVTVSFVSIWELS
jgi:hypothetical protein